MGILPGESATKTGWYQTTRSRRLTASGGETGAEEKEPKKRQENSLINKVPGCIKRPVRYIADVESNFQIMNCQSLKFKLRSLAENFNINKSTFILTSETWFKKSDKQLSSYLANIEDGSSLLRV